MSSEDNDLIIADLTNKLKKVKKKFKKTRNQKMALQSQKDMLQLKFDNLCSKCSNLNRKFLNYQKSHRPSCIQSPPSTSNTNSSNSVSQIHQK